MVKHSQAQISAIVNSRRSARVIQRAHPEIANFYRKGHSYSQIASQIGIAKDYGISQSTANVIICMAIKGYNEDYGIPALEGLIPKDELSRLTKAHMIASSKQNGKDSFERRVGVHAQTPEERSAHSLRNYRNGRGLGGLSHKKRVEIGKKAGKKTALARGYVLWKEAKNDREISERDLLGYLSYSPHFFYKTGTHKNKRNLGKIVLELNIVYHNGKNVRNKSSVRNAILYINKSSERKTKVEMVAELEELTKVI